MNENPVQYIDAVEHWLRELQGRICAEVEALDGAAKFATDQWDRPEGGGGITRILKNGATFEQAGVNFSRISGERLPEAATAQRPELVGRAFEALGLSLVLHPTNPYVPITHMNLRFFIANKDGADPVWWFGGGLDLTPCYPTEEDVIHWHTTAKAACQPFGDEVYPKYKKWCDEYFYLKHRDETRGVGGLFFDDLNEWGFERCFAFVKSVGDHFSAAYAPIVKRNKTRPFGVQQRNFLLYRRGRYVEFNLVYDRGTLFGLQTGGRVESILMSLPPQATWLYNWKPAPGSPEEALTRDFLQPRDWV